MATELKQGGEEGGKKGRRRRAKERAEALAESAVTLPVAVPETAAPPEVAAETVPVVTVRRAERRRVTRRKAEPPAVDMTEPQPAVEDEFRDLLGQAIGLRLDGVTKEFDSGDMKVVALRDVSLEIGPGEFVAVIGPSGCGKTTLLSLMGGLDQPTTGQVYASGMALDQLSDDALADYRLQRVCTIFQHGRKRPRITGIVTARFQAERQPSSALLKLQIPHVAQIPVSPAMQPLYAGKSLQESR